jgi:hypothetical protein
MYYYRLQIEWDYEKKVSREGLVFFLLLHLLLTVIFLLCSLQCHCEHAVLSSSLYDLFTACKTHAEQSGGFDGMKRLSHMHCLRFCVRLGCTLKRLL